MSKTVDERIVQMQFQNSQFEKNIQTSMNSIDKLNKSLNFTGASKGLDSISSATKNFNMSGVANAVETVRSRFSALEVMGVTALANITNSAVNAGKRIVSSLTIEPVKAGFNEYEMKMDSVKTIMASTGEELETVNKYLEELNEYSDKTIYSFSDMTQNIGKFTNAGVGLEDAVLAIKGISNEAALSGANANEASRAMYNFAQALSSGHVKHIDWKSIELANMATVGFKEELIATAVEMGTLVKVGDKYKSTTTDANGRVSELFNSTQMFNESLSAQWMTTDVLVKTLGRYADETTDIGKKAFAAAQDVTKVSQVFDILKETAQSGWSKTWEILIGDIEQAKAILTPITNFLAKIIDGMSDFRNNLLEGALGSNPFKNLAGKLDESGLGTLKKYSDATSKLAGDLEYYQSIVDKVWHGDYKNADTGRYELLDADGYDHRIVQDLVNKGAEYRLTVEDIAESQKKFGIEASKTTDSMDDIAVALENLTDEQLIAAGFTKEEIKLFRQLAEEAKKAGVPLSQLLEESSKLDGRTLLIQGLANVGKSIVTIFGAIKDAWMQAFPPMQSSTLYNIIESFNRLSQKLVVSDKTADRLKRTFAGVFSVIGLGVDIVKGIVKLAATVIGKVLGGITPIGGGILEITARMGDFLVAFRASVSSVDGFKNALLKLWEYLKIGASAIKDFILNVVDLAKSIKSFDDFKEIGGNMISGIIVGIKDKAASAVEAIVGVGKKIVTAVKDFFGIHSPSLLFMAIGGFIIAGLVAGLKDTSAVGGALGKVFSVVKKAFDVVVNIVTTIGKVLDPVISALCNMFGELFNAISGAIKEGGIETVLDVIKVFIGGSLVKGINGFLDSFKGIGDGLGGSLKSIVGILDGVKGALSAYQNAINAEALMNIAKALAILVVSIIAITLIDAGKLMESLKAFGTLMLELGAFIKLSGIDTLGLSAGASILFLASGLLVLVGVIALLGIMNMDTLTTGMMALGAVLAGLAIAMDSLSGNSPKGVLAAAAAITLISQALVTLTGVLFLMGQMSFDTIKTGLLAIAGVLLVLVMAVNTLSASKGVVQASVAITLISQALITLAGVLFLMGSMDITTIAKGLAAMGGALLILVLALNTISGEKMITSSVAMASLAGTLIALAAAVALMGSMKFSTIAKGLLGMAGALAIITLTFNSIIASGMVTKAAAFIVVSASLMVLSSALAAMGALPLSVIGKGLLVLAGSLIILSAALVVMTVAKQGAVAMLIAVAALAVLVPVLTTLGVVAPIAALGLIVIAGAFTVLGVAALVLGPMAISILALSSAITLLGVGMGLFGAGVLTLSMGLATLVAIGAPAAEALKLVFMTIIEMIVLAAVQLALGITVIITTIGNSMGPICAALLQIVVAITAVIIAALPPIMLAVGKILDSLITLLIKYTPKIMDLIEKVLLEVLDLLVDSAYDIADAALAILIAVLEALDENMYKITELACDIIVEFLDGIADKLPDIIDSAISVLDSFIQGIIDNLDNLFDTAIDLLVALLDGIANALDTRWNDICEAAEAVILALVEAIGYTLGSIVSLGPKIIEKLIEGLKKGLKDLGTMGKDIVQGLIDGIKSGWEKLKKGATDWCKSIKDAFCGFFGIKSPSRMFMEFGGYMVEGLAIGLTENTNEACGAARNMAEQVTDAFGKPMLQLADPLLGEINTTPTIRPVLDLTDVRSGAKTIGGMFSNRALTVSMQPVNDLASTMANIQNGTGSNEVVSAINKLRKDIADNPKTVNNINGITYDDGSNILGAIETIVRVANIERRS